jgi:hypothetical protein
LGTGGVDQSDPFTPISPTNQNTNLITPIMINSTDTNCGDHRDSPVAGFYKHPFDSIEFEQDEMNDNKYLVTKITVTIDSYDANDHLLSEAGLFVSTTSAASHTGPFYLYARVTFPAQYKDSNRSLLFVWYIYF